MSMAIRRALALRKRYVFVPRRESWKPSEAEVKQFAEIKCDMRDGVFRVTNSESKGRAKGDRASLLRSLSLQT